MTKRSPTTKDVALLHQLSKNGQLTLAEEFQRNAVWPHPAKAYLIDTILNDRPIPLLFFQRSTSAQTGLSSYTVIDGQQRLRAIFEFLENRFRLSQSSQSSKKGGWYNKRFSDLSPNLQDKIRNYDLVVEELSGYSENDIRDMFVRFNKYVVRLVPQELRHARGGGKFHEFVEKFGKDPFWKNQKVFSPNSIQRMRSVEFAAELTILLIEGPQDKKASVDLYYSQYQARFPYAKSVAARLNLYLKWIVRVLPNFATTRYRSPVDLYSLIGAFDRLSDHGVRSPKIKPKVARERLLEFERKTKVKLPTGDAARYVAAASRQTDNLIPRSTRIGILTEILTP
jgi:hypothetical protein